MRTDLRQVFQELSVEHQGLVEALIWNFYRAQQVKVKLENQLRQDTLVFTQALASGEKKESALISTPA